LSLTKGEITAGEYFDKEFDLCGRDIGRSKEIRTKVNKFKVPIWQIIYNFICTTYKFFIITFFYYFHQAQVWLCEDYPLNLQEQIMPIIDIMALSSPMFSKLKNFIQMQIPAGFPVKIGTALKQIIEAFINNKIINVVYS